MAQDYDKIFKENIEAIILPLAKRLLNIHPEYLEEIPDDLQRTIERRPDFLKRVRNPNTDKTYILHVEFQTEDDLDMVYRMNEYHAILLRQYKLEIQQYVFFLKPFLPRMPTSFEYPNMRFEFHLFALVSENYRNFLESDTLEEVILAILGNFGSDKPDTVIAAILQKIQNAPQPLLQKQKVLKQLEILSNLRKLQPQIINQLSTMAFVYNIKEDLRYQQGFEDANKLAELKLAEKEREMAEKEREMVEKQEREIREMALQLFAMGILPENIASMLSRPKDWVEQAIHQNKDKK